METVQNGALLEVGLNRIYKSLRMAKIYIPKFILKFIVQPCFRIFRGQTLGVRGVVLDDQNRVLLVRHTYVPGWMFPGGGVEQHETLLAALGKELDQEVGVHLKNTPELFGVYANFKGFKGDHVAVYIVREWDQVERRSLEISESGFFDPDNLPDETTSGTKRRLREILSGVEQTQAW